jgi:hypothetical protein
MSLLNPPDGNQIRSEIAVNKDNWIAKAKIAVHVGKPGHRSLAPGGLAGLNLHS